MFEMTEAIYAAIMDFGRSGWPVFAAMAALAGHLSSGIVDPGSTSHCEVNLSRNPKRCRQTGSR